MWNKVIVRILIIALFLIVSPFGNNTEANINPLSYPKFRAYDSNNDPLTGGKLYTFLPNTDTPAIVYSDIGLTVPHSNPIILDSNGEAEIYVPSARKLVLKTSAGVTIWTMNYVGQPLPSNVVNAVDYGVIGTQAAIEAELTSIGADNRTLYLRKLQHQFH